MYFKNNRLGLFLNNIFIIRSDPESEELYCGLSQQISFEKFGDLHFFVIGLFWLTGYVRNTYETCHW